VSDMRVAEVDGVPVLIGSGPGPMRAGLMFRVGRVDESLASGGISHLVEHLALHRHGVADYHYNGMTSATTTQFVIQGSSGAIVDFLHGVCASLRDLPISRLDVEKKIIQTEAAGRGITVNHEMPLWRHGARDFGLVSYPEWGTHTVTGEQITSWAAQRFTRGNAVLWIAGDGVPTGLRLDLPDGPRRSLPAESSALPVTPAYFAGSTPMIVMDAQVPRTRAAVVYVQALERALYRELRQKLGLSYTVATGYLTDGRARATVTLVADAQPDRVGAVLDGILAELRKLRDTDLDPTELDAIRSLELNQLARADVEADLLPRRATDLLTGFTSPTTAEIIDGFRRVTAADVREIAGTVHETALLKIPPASRWRPPPGFEAAPTLSRFALTGTRYRSRLDPGTALVHGDAGVSMVGATGAVTVPYDECVALLRWPDGARHLFAADGINVRIEPTVYGIPPATLTRIDAAIASAHIVDLPERRPEAIPAPSRVTAMRGRTTLQLRPWRARLDRFAAFRGGTRAVVYAAGIAAASVMTATVGIVDGPPQLIGIAVVGGGGALLWRRRNLGHW
jgi:hypothetical protein